MRDQQLQAKRELRFDDARFPGFLLSTVLPLIALPFADLHGNLLQRLCLPVAISLLVWQSIWAMPAWMARYGPISLNCFYRLTGVMTAASLWITFLEGHHWPWFWRGFFSVVRAVFYIMTAIRIIQILARCTNVNRQMLCLGAAGYIHMGLTGGQLATALQVIDSDSFSFGTMAQGEELLARLSYFAFVTIGTLGYGDIVPRSPLGESFVVLLSLASTLYISLLIGILLGRYIHTSPLISKRSADSEDF